MNFLSYRFIYFFFLGIFYILTYSLHDLNVKLKFIKKILFYFQHILNLYSNIYSLNIFVFFSLLNSIIKIILEYNELYLIKMII